MLSGVSLLIILLSAYLTRRNWNKYRRIQQLRARKEQAKTKERKAR